MTAVVLDTNVVARIVMEDDGTQSAIACSALASASLVIIPTHVFCELVWVMRSIKTNTGERRYSYGAIATGIRRFIEFDHLVISADEVAAGLQMLDCGGDFADGVIEYTGRNLAHDVTTTFLSFDKSAVSTLAKRGLSALLLQ
ncbi:MAG: type II toxin-antitoxin system VapC family toxin [Pseudomonadales bacterium]|jgi:predicted nucleic-acid-binding protein|nr:type II toxin-antitoxin system VapC family toxin [Pseudomonadales bacterium]